MPTNVTVEYAAAEMEYQRASTKDEKIRALQKMYSTVPKHKGTEKLRQEIKTKLAKLKEAVEKEKKQKSSGHSITIKKEGAAQIVLVGYTNTGKSSLLNRLCGTKARVNDYPYTTKVPEVGVMNYKNVRIQVVEIPAVFEGYAEKGNGPQYLSILRSADLAVVVVDSGDISTVTKELKKAYIKLNEIGREEDDSWVNMKAVLVLNKTDLSSSEHAAMGLQRYYNFDIVKISALKNEGIDRLKDVIWKNLGLIKVFTKEMGKKPTKDPMALKKGSTVADMAEHIHRDFIKKFRFARVWGKSAKFSAQIVGLDHMLEDDDVVELHLK